MPKIFESLRMRRPRYSAFDLSHEKKLSFDMAELIPILCEEIVPGDHFKIQTEVMLRFAPMIAPIMHRVNAYVHYFFVPNRLVWDEWEDFITGGQDGTDTPVMPTFSVGSSALDPGTLWDYMGIGGVAAGGGDNAQVQALPFRAYQEIYNTYYRDETLDPVVDWAAGSTPATTLRSRRWEKDYFTSSLPWAQRGPEVTIDGNIVYKDPALVTHSGGTKPTDGANVTTEDLAGGTTAAINAGGTQPLAIDNIDSLNITINELRESSRLQEWLEKNARGGYRYIEQLLSHFGVRSSDARLQRPEYLGGGRQPVVISEVLNTSATGSQAQGTMAGHGISVGTANRARRRFEEHGWLFGILSVIPRTNYQQGIPRKFSRTDKLDYYFPEFAHLGEQEVLNQELYYSNGDTDATNQGTFGYQQRYAEYKYGCSSVHGEFKTTLAHWHLGRIWNSRPGLTSTFVNCNPDTRIFAVETGDKMWCQVYNDVKARRPMPYFSNPKL